MSVLSTSTLPAGKQQRDSCMKLRSMYLRGAAAAILALAAVAAMSIIALVFLWILLIPAYVLLEIAFVFYFMHKHRQLNKQPQPHMPPPPYNPRDVFDRFIYEQHKVSKYLCIKEMMQKWFWNVPYEQIKRGNVADLLVYGFWYKSREQLEAEGQGHLPDQLMDELEEAWNLRFPPGRTENLPFMAHLWQDVRCHYRPLGFYLGIELMFLAKHMLLVGGGFKAHRHNGYTYYTHGMDAPLQQAPTLFMHGVGLGLLPYVTFVMRLVAQGQPVIALECPHLGMRLVHEVPCVDEVVEEVMAVLDKHGVQKVCVTGHSYGTFMCSRIVQQYPQRVQSLALIDPVCFIMFSGKLIHNFVYAPESGSLSTWVVARDIHHATSVCRRFYWSLLTLWPDQLPAHTLVVMSGQDELVPVQESMTMLEHESNAAIMYHGKHGHAHFIHDLPWQDQVVEQIGRMREAAQQGVPFVQGPGASVIIEQGPPVPRFGSQGATPPLEAAAREAAPPQQQQQGQGRRSSRAGVISPGRSRMKSPARSGETAAAGLGAKDGAGVHHRNDSADEYDRQRRRQQQVQQEQDLKSPGMTTRSRARAMAAVGQV
mmetsp:Transcript_23683/g.51983  ORF Transcript_23683/g.51983 Transcript_23683/m.51983 type:complete len:595 (+) Transcript_23683:246-2030(+)|eukprot:CAMPEP_0202894018 /NCGR_PEP_ID=MMETSP1392-20130828/3485_1 /ASSEMBLY_ACC=CAM_ASM_000868 /TAXON_ID=225041 /ORGANISM="Chlamydomonas chlamydogama, Strain SAG 11-48b" /LENGTH=594 /DNA_ID=CAMNT_0049578551 /DNA_START=189 /DNA_END=1973 /DNA_ORIENTATION=-